MENRPRPATNGVDFKLKTEFKPSGDQAKAIKKLEGGLKSGAEHQVLFGVTGSGKTFTAANTIAATNKPTLIISHNKTLAWQLYREFKEFFPENSVNYFVSYYDYYQPEAYIPQTDTYITKDASINKKIDKMRHAAVQNLLTRPDCIVVASVSCIYNIGSPQTYQKVVLDIKRGQKFTRKELIRSIVNLGFVRNDFAPESGNFRAKGSRLELYPATGESPFIIEVEKDSIENISQDKKNLNSFQLHPANFWITPDKKLKIAMSNIRAELQEHLQELKKQNPPAGGIEAYRLEKKTNYDLEMMDQVGYCQGIENYSRHLDFRAPGEAPHTLLDYFSVSSSPLRNGAKDFLTIVDESHMTIPQIRGMHAGDRARKETLIKHGFRLPSAVDNRPLDFKEFDEHIGQTIYMSATPARYELEKCRRLNAKGQMYNGVAEQIMRPTGLVDPKIEVRPLDNQVKNAISEIDKVIKKGSRALVVTITKRLAEHIAEFMKEKGMKVNYIHSEVNTLKRPFVMQKLREGEYDVLVGINLLREGLDFPEVSLVVILDADKEGFLRNKTTLLQTAGRAARHVEGRAILYADKITNSIQETIDETERRRQIQLEHNKKHGIEPKSIKKKIYPLPKELYAEEEDDADMDMYKKMAKEELGREMKKAAKEMDFEKAAKIRDEIRRIEDSQ